MTKNIVILTTGGTIAGVGKPSQNAYSSAKTSGLELINAIPEIKNIANISCEQILSIGSQNICDDDLIKIANYTNKILAQKTVDGVVITHGTDTLEETAYFLNLTIKSHKPVILTGAVRASTSLSADGPINLYNAVSLAANDKASNKGVLVVFADNIFAARDISKSNASGIDGFNNSSGKIGHISYGKAEIYYQPTRIHTENSEFNIANISSLPKVDIILMNSGFDPDIINRIITPQTKGIVIAGVGNGNIHNDALPKLINARKDGIFIFKSSRIGNGFVVPNVEINDDELEFITTDNLNPQKACILAKLALETTNNFDQIKNFFTKY